MKRLLLTVCLLSVSALFAQDLPSRIDRFVEQFADDRGFSGSVVVAEKGWGGGYALAATATEVPLGDLLALFDEHPGPVECPFPEPICGCRVAHDHAAATGVAPHGVSPGGAIVCPYGGVECINPVPCPLQAHWGKVREGYLKLSTTRVGELTEVAIG